MSEKKVCEKLEKKVVELKGEVKTLLKNADATGAKDVREKRKLLKRAQRRLRTITGKKMQNIQAMKKKED